jgi:hypothetical protein
MIMPPPPSLYLPYLNLSVDRHRASFSPTILFLQIFIVIEKHYFGQYFQTFYELVCGFESEKAYPLRCLRLHSI